MVACASGCWRESKGRRKKIQCDENILHLNCGGGCILCTISKIHETEHSKWVNSTVYKLYFSKTIKCFEVSKYFCQQSQMFYALVLVLWILQIFHFQALPLPHLGNLINSRTSATEVVISTPQNSHNDFSLYMSLGYFKLSIKIN